MTNATAFKYVEAANDAIYFSDVAAMITIEQVKKALFEIGDKYPSANTDILINNIYNVGNKRPADIVNEKGGEYFLNEVRQCVDWLTHFNFTGTKRRSPNRRHSSYGYKHHVERWIQHVKRGQCGRDVRDYVSNLAFIVAAWLMDIPETCLNNDGNPCYPLSEKTIQHAEHVTRYQHKYSRLTRSKLAQAADQGRKLARLVEQYGQITGWLLETHPDCSWWRTLTLRERVLVLDSFDAWSANGNLNIRADYSGAFIIKCGAPRNRLGDMQNAVNA